MSKVLNTSTMKSPPLVVCVAGSLIGGIVSAAARRGPGGAALARGAAANGAVVARTGVASAAAPAIVAPFKKLRRPESGELRLAIISSRGSRTALAAPHVRHSVGKSLPGFAARQGNATASST